MTSGPIFTYRALLQDGGLKPDTVQELAVEKLQALYHALKGYKPNNGKGGWKERLGLARRKSEPPMGLYMFGGVGRGKSMLMDLFFEHLPMEEKRRVHFHEFMLEIHKKVHAWRLEQKNRADSEKETDPLPKLAADIAERSYVLCFDEFHVTDIADAMILGRLFEALFEAGVVVVTTSNWEPDLLYKDGLQRENFLPFISLLKEKLDILHLDSPTDYRLMNLRSQKVYFAPLGPGSTRGLNQAFELLRDGAEIKPVSIPLRGREITIERTARNVAEVDFYELFEKPRGAEDYLALAEHFRAFILDGVPVMREAQRNEAKRFMMFIDALYEHHCILVLAAEKAPEDLYREGTHAFEFERTVSRLMEMQTAEYLEKPHRHKNTKT